MSRRKDLKFLEDFIKPYGLHVKIGRKHNKICRASGQAIYTFSSSPSDGYWLENTIRDLVKYKYVKARSAPKPKR